MRLKISSQIIDVDDFPPVFNFVVDMMSTTMNTEITTKYGIYVFNQMIPSIELKIVADLPLLYDDYEDYDTYVLMDLTTMIVLMIFMIGDCRQFKLNCNNYCHFANRNKKFGCFSSFHYYVMLITTYDGFTVDYCENIVKFVLRADKIRYTLRDITDNSNFRSQFKSVDENELESIIEEFEDNALIHRIGLYHSRRLIKTLISVKLVSKDGYKLIIKLLPKFGTYIDYSNERINEEFKSDDDIVEESKVKGILIENVITEKNNFFY
ncbi:hypothetical protein SNEBB_000421 [Seison nebaliae]|nr:hypothetical protein SNEBB_000421 [Seison nebaliae]